MNMIKVSRFFPFILLCILLLPWTEVGPASVSIFTSKPVYYRYELVEISVLWDGEAEDSLDVDTLVASVFCQDSLVRSIGGAVYVPCLRLNGQKQWKGYWPVPWNPRLGTYTVEIGIMHQDSSRTALARDSFDITGRTLEPIDSGFCVMNIESTNDFLENPFPTPFGPPGTQESFVTWAQFLGADAIFYSVGQTMEGQAGVTDEQPWYPLNIELFPKVAATTKEAGLRFGGWIGCYFLWGETLKELDYTYSWDYWSPSQRMYQPHRISITDEKRLSDIIDVVKQLNADPNVDFVGLDYIRTGFGGYEMVDEFVREMSIGVPERWTSFSPGEKRRWLALEIEVEKDPEDVEKWQWYCAHRVAHLVHRIIEQSGLEKPLWVFLLGWRHGQEHGQDPIMFYDAGADWCAVMLYESDADHCRELNASWSSYVDKGEVNLLVGESVDWDLLQNSTNPPGPEEFYRRLVEAVDSFYCSGPVEGAFWHDLHRGAWGKRGPYRRIEWAITGAAAFSYVRWRNKRLPLGAVLKGPEEVPVGKPFDVSVSLINDSSEDVHDIVIEPIRIPGIRYSVDGPIRVGTLRTHTETAVTFRCIHLDGGHDSGAQSMVAARTTWIESTPQNLFVSFAYVKRR
jgi:hypothetical protein